MLHVSGCSVFELSNGCIMHGLIQWQCSMELLRNITPYNSGSLLRVKVHVESTQTQCRKYTRKIGAYGI